MNNVYTNNTPVLLLATVYVAQEDRLTLGPRHLWVRQATEADELPFGSQNDWVALILTSNEDEGLLPRDGSKDWLKVRGTWLAGACAFQLGGPALIEALGPHASRPIGELVPTSDRPAAVGETPFVVKCGGCPTKRPLQPWSCSKCGEKLWLCNGCSPSATHSCEKWGADDDHAAHGDHD